MKEISKTNVCERVEDLIGFLYGELGERDAQLYEHHLRDCASCKVEFMAFGKIRTSIGEWRDESLGARSPAFAEQPMLAPSPSQGSFQPKPSALAALRQIFVLSPSWMRAAAAFATVMFCVCAVLAVAYLKTHQSSVARVPDGVPDKASSRQDFNEQVAREVQKRLDDLEHSKQKEGKSVVAQRQPPERKTNIHSSISTSSETARGARRPFTPRERQELASDLRLVTSTDDEDLDLIGGDASRSRP